MHKIGVIGEKGSIPGFGAIGVDVRPIVHTREAVRELQRMKESGYAVIFITEHLAEELREVTELYNKDVLPAIIPIPGIRGKTGMGMKGIKAAVERAAGVDFLFKGD